MTAFAQEDTNSLPIEGDNTCDDIPTFDYLNSFTLANITASSFLVTQFIDIDGSTFLEGKTIKMGPNAIISIRNYALLSLNNCKIEGCVEMWDGINVGSHSTFRCQASEINDMRFGIDPTMDAFIYLQESRFMRNAITVDSRNDVSFTFDYYGNIINGANLKQPLSGIATAGLYFENVLTTMDDPIKIGNALKNENIFEHCKTGIIGKNFKFDMENNRFEGGRNGLITGIDIENAEYPAIISSTFNNCEYGIKATQSSYNIKNNIFKQMGYCIWAKKSRLSMSALSPRVENNVVDGAQGGAYFFSNDGSNPQVVDNVIKDLNGPGIFFLDFAINNKCNIANNTVNDNGGSGYPPFSGVNNNGFMGIILNGTQKASVCDNNINFLPNESLQNTGIQAVVSSNCILTNNHLTQTTFSGGSIGGLGHTTGHF